MNDCANVKLSQLTEWSTLPAGTTALLTEGNRATERRPRAPNAPRFGAHSNPHPRTILGALNSVLQGSTRAVRSGRTHRLRGYRAQTWNVRARS
jgi:hypothetical protein